MATYAIGDVQGCFAKLQNLLLQICYQPHRDVLWFVGDLVNRGPDSLTTLRFISSLDNAVVVLGNHDLHLLAVYYGLKEFYADDTIQDILAAPDCDQLLFWLRQQKLMHYDAQFDIVMTHAGVAPQWSLQQALELAHEVEMALQGNTVTDYLSHMYGNMPDCWQDHLTGLDRLRVITNYFTRMRFCSAKGELIMNKKTAPLDCPPGGMPWFKVPGRKMQAQKIVFGHWSALQGQTHEPNVFALDTGVVWGGPLTALRLDDLQRFSA